jgi:hypothetical protein
MLGGGLARAFLVATALLGTACREEGATADCPELPRYDLKTDAALDPSTLEALQAAEDAGCLTPPGDAEPVRAQDATADADQ